MNRFVFILFTPLLFIACAPKITKLVKKIKTSDGLDTMIFEKKAIGSSKFCDEKGKNCTYTLEQSMTIMKHNGLIWEIANLVG
jgi:azurin